MCAQQADYLFRELRRLNTTFNFYVVPQERRRSSIWGGSSLLDVVLDGFAVLSTVFPDADFFINLSESDFPLRFVDQIVFLRLLPEPQGHIGVFQASARVCVSPGEKSWNEFSSLARQRTSRVLRQAGPRLCFRRVRASDVVCRQGEVRCWRYVRRRVGLVRARSPFRPLRRVRGTAAGGRGLVRWFARVLPKQTSACRGAVDPVLLASRSNKCVSITGVLPYAVGKLRHVFVPRQLTPARNQLATEKELRM